MAHSPTQALDVGSVIADTYTIEGLLGRGGMGAVFVASHVRLPGKKVAIKVLHPDVADAESLARFRREAEIASRLGHPNIVEVHDWNQLPDGTPYLVLELLVGESLADRLRRGPMTLAEVTPIMRQVGAALAAAHREGIVHRDLKPANIFLIPQDEGPPRAKVLDFGISKIQGSMTVKTQDTQMLGTPQYMAPEQATGRHDQVDGRTDVFALGAVVFEMLTGQAAFGGATIPEVVFKVVFDPAPSVASLAPGVPAAAAAAVDRALAKKPEERWPDVAAFVEALTGAPLATGRGPIPTNVRPAVGPATPTKQSTQDAFAQTVGSGDHGSALASQARDALKAGPVPSANTVASAPALTTAPKKRTGVIVGAVLVLAGAAVAAVVVLGGGKGATPTPTPAPGAALDAGPAPSAPPDAAAVAPDALAVVPAALDAGAPEDAGAALADAAPPSDAHLAHATDARPAAPRVDAGAASPPDDGDDGDDDPGLKAAVAEARAALRAEDPDQALQVTRAALNKFPSAQVLFEIRAEAYCQNQDLGAAKAALRSVTRPRLKAQAKRACKAAGVEL
jgi:serine/threonine protein kinase